jgi:hypothetical protein
MIKVILGERVFLYPTGIFHRRRYELIFEREHTSNMEGSLATALRSAPTKESPAPVVSTGLTENPPTFPLKFCNQIISPKIDDSFYYNRKCSTKINNLIKCSY